MSQIIGKIDQNIKARIDFIQSYIDMLFDRYESIEDVGVDVVLALIERKEMLVEMV